MKKWFLSSLVLAGLFISLTSAVSPGSMSPALKDSLVQARITEGLKDGKLTYSELKGAAETYKGTSLTMREKLMLRVFKAKVVSKTKPYAAEGKSQLVALLLCLFVGGIGIHRFYLGYTWQGIVQILTLGGLGIWTLIDLIRIITGDLKPKGADYAKPF